MDPLKIWLDKKILICMGSGGVGKTTVTTALALSAARRGLNVLALTVDPSQRLIRQLGIDAQNPSAQQVPLGLEKGSLWASVLNSKWIFDDFVLRNSTDEALARKLMNNALYRQLSTTLSGSQEFTSLELLCREYEKGLYDLIILDTPPTQHALDFLHAPNQLRELFDESILKWFRSDRIMSSDKWYSRAFQFGTKKVLRAMSLLTGEGFTHSLTDFFQSVSGVQGAVAARGVLFDEILKGESTGFVGVAGFEKESLRDTQELRQELSVLGVDLMGVIVNRCFPFSDMSEESFENEKLRSEWKRYMKLFNETIQAFQEFETNISAQMPLVKLPRRFFVGEELMDLEALREMPV